MTVSSSTTLILLLQLIATSAMVGVIWQVQLITYPQFLTIESVSFPTFHSDYCRRITWIVGPFMLLELATAASSSLFLWNSPLRSWAIVSLVLVFALWAVTATIQVPQHETLSHGLDREVAGSLVKGNWIRVAGWSLRLLLCSGILYAWIQSLRAPASE